MSMNVLAKCPEPKLICQIINGKLVRNITSCNKCPTCRTNLAKEQAMRLTHEAMSHKDNKGNIQAIFFTTTYDNPHMIVDKRIPKKHALDMQGTLIKEHPEKFIKRVREYAKKKLNKKIRFYYAGEYGGITKRPHFHFIIYGVNYNELNQEKLQSMWKYGKVYTDNKTITHKATQYISNYSVKIDTEFQDKDMYEGDYRLKPFSAKSKNLGVAWFKEHAEEILDTGYIVFNGQQLNIPRTYFKAIYKEEGEILRPIEYREDENGNIKKIHNHRVIRNDNGRLTSKINELKKKSNDIKIANIDTKYDYVNNEEDKNRVKANIEYNFETYKQYSEDVNKDYKSQIELGTTKEEIESKLAESIFQNRVNRYIKMIYYFWIHGLKSFDSEYKKNATRKKYMYISDITWETLNQEARNKVRNKLTSPYGKRDKVA